MKIAKAYVWPLIPQRTDGPSYQKWIIQHIPTGMPVGVAGFRTKKDCLAFIALLKPEEQCWQEVGGNPMLDGTYDAWRACLTLYEQAGKVASSRGLHT